MELIVSGDPLIEIINLTENSNISIDRNIQNFNRWRVQQSLTLNRVPNIVPLPALDFKAKRL